MKKNGTRMGALVLLAALIFGFALGSAKGQASAAENAAGELSKPAKQAATGIIGWLEGIYGYMFRYDELAAENEALKTKLATAENELREAKQFVRENERLRKVLELRPKHKDFKFESAMIIDRPPSNWSDTLTISKGKESDLQVGDCVVDSAYNLVGQITELGTGWATVRTLIDADMRVGALVGEGGSAAVVVGDFGLMARGEIKLSYLSDKAQVLEGDIILTSGKGGSFPRGLVIGSVTGIQTEAGGQVEYATLTPASELSKLSQVFVIKDFDVVE
ncbi:MAG: rod shape-determining protein MreC [Oscillospiraceae bacterium]